MGRRTDSLLTERRLVVLSVLVTLVTVVPVTRMLGEAWDEQGLVFNLVWYLTTTLGVDIDVAVVFPVGLVVGWLLLFGLDDYKRVQGVILLAAVPVGVVTLASMNKWVGTVSWLALSPFLLGGVVLAGGVGLLSGRQNRKTGRREFPLAPRLLYATAAVVTVVGFVERHVAYDSPVVVNRATGAVTGGSLGPVGLVFEGLAVDLVSSVAFLVVLSWFVQYTNRSDVLVVRPDEGNGRLAETRFLAAMMQVAWERYDATSLSAGSAFNTDVRNVSSEEDVVAVDGRRPATVSFRFTQPGLLSRRTVIESRSYGPPSERDVRRIERRLERESGLPYRVAHLLSRPLSLLVPDRVRALVASDPARFVNRVASADTVVLLAPVDDRINQYALDEGETSFAAVLRDEPRYVDRYSALCAAYRGHPGTDVFVVATQANSVAGFYEQTKDRLPRLDSDRFARFVGEQVLGIGGCDVVPVDDSFGESGPQGIDRVLKRL
jgi:uncharacterized membrane protein YciS (DUF1049 family)